MHHQFIQNRGARTCLSLPIWFALIVLFCETQMAHRGGRQRGKKPSTTSHAAPAPIPSAAKPAIVAVVVLAVYLAALMFRADRVPAGMSNDVAEEALRGVYLVKGQHFEVITFSLGNSAETLYLYLMGIAANLFGPTTTAIHAVSWTCALVCIWMVSRLVVRIDSSIPAAVPLCTAACSIWLFHYARSGLRAIIAPCFLCAFTWLLERVERRPTDRWTGLAGGAVLGLGIYGYTSARILPVAFGIFVLYRLLRQKGRAMGLLPRYLPVVAGAFLISIPNLLFLIRHPKEFLTRGDYVLRGTAADHLENFIATLEFPVHYPSTYNIVFTPGHYFDGVSVALSSAFSPVHIIFAVAMLFGLYRSRRYLENPVVTFLLAAWISAIAILGIAGPSLTRLLIILPAILTFAALGFDGLRQIHPRLGIAGLALILLTGITDGSAYLSGGAQASEYYGGAATAIGKQASVLASQGRPVLCILSSAANVTRFLTSNQEQRVKVIEFYGRPLNPNEIPWNETGQYTMLVENTVEFKNFFQSRFGSVVRFSPDFDFFTIAPAAGP